MAKSMQTKPVSAPTSVVRVRLTRPHGWFDETGKHRFWHIGRVVDDAADVAALIKRGAPIEILE